MIDETKACKNSAIQTYKSPALPSFSAFLCVSILNLKNQNMNLKGRQLQSFVMTFDLLTLPLTPP